VLLPGICYSLVPQCLLPGSRTAYIVYYLVLEHIVASLIIIIFGITNYLLLS